MSAQVDVHLYAATRARGILAREALIIRALTAALPELAAKLPDGGDVGSRLAVSFRGQANSAPARVVVQRILGVQRYRRLRDSVRYIDWRVSHGRVEEAIAVIGRLRADAGPRGPQRQLRRAIDRVAADHPVVLTRTPAEGRVSDLLADVVSGDDPDGSRGRRLVDALQDGFDRDARSRARDLAHHLIACVRYLMDTQRETA